MFKNKIKKLHVLCVSTSKTIKIYICSSIGFDYFFLLEKTIHSSEFEVEPVFLISETKYRIYSKSKGLNKEERDFLYREIFLSNEWVELDRGTMNREEAINVICNKNPKESELIRAHCDFENILTPITHNVEILKELKDY